MISIIIVCGAVLLGAQMKGFWPLLFAISTIAIAVSHSLPGLRLKEIKPVKPLTSAGAYAFLLLFVVSYLGNVTAKTVIFAIFLGALSVCGSIYRDIFDEKYDRKSWIRTYATEHTAEFIAGLFKRITLIQYAILVTGIVAGVLEPAYLLLMLIIPLRYAFMSRIWDEHFDSKTSALSLSSYISTAIIIGVVEHVL